MQVLCNSCLFLLVQCKVDLIVCLDRLGCLLVGLIGDLPSSSTSSLFKLAANRFVSLPQEPNLLLVLSSRSRRSFYMSINHRSNHPQCLLQQLC